jgi:MYXO-CTERM domain-containing protein
MHMIRSLRLGVAVLAGILTAGAQRADAFGIFGNTIVAGGARWDAAPRNIGGLERSLSGGLRFSVTGGSYQGFRDNFAWSGGVPSVAVFQQTVQEAFGTWLAVDPATNLGTTISFTQDFGTAVDTSVVGGVRQVAEIDIHAFNFGDAGTRGDTFFNWSGGNVTLTSGTANYPSGPGGPINGADIRINSNPGASYTIDVFRLLLSHEIGHALGLADVDLNSGPGGTYIDDNYSGGANTVATLNNSFALMIDPLNPAASAGLSMYTVPNANPGFDSPGVNIHMESEGLGGQFGNLSPMTNDDYAGRQFLYPTVVPEPAAGIAALAGVVALWARRRRA